MCSNCYHSKGRIKKPWNCPHTNKTHYALGLCQNCYQMNYIKKQSVIEINKKNFVNKNNSNNNINTDDNNSLLQPIVNNINLIKKVEDKKIKKNNKIINNLNVIKNENIKSNKEKEKEILIEKKFKLSENTSIESNNSNINNVNNNNNNINNNSLNNNSNTLF